MQIFHFILISKFRPEFLPMSFPTDISEKLLTLHSSPPVFFVSQVPYLYILRAWPKATILVPLPHDALQQGDG